MTAMATDSMLEQLWEASPVPGCEIRPDLGSDEPCGDPSVALVLFAIAHFAGCPMGKQPECDIWVCAPHLDQARKGATVCSSCPGRATVLRVIG